MSPPAPSSAIPPRAARNTPPITPPIIWGGPAFSADPVAHYAWLREHAPVHAGRIAALTDQDVWFVSRYDDVKTLLTDDRFLRAPGGASAMTAEVPAHLRLFTTDSLLYKDDPEHRRLRKLVVTPFTPKAIAQLGDRVRQIAHALLDDLVGQDPVELRETYALPIPTTVIAEMLGVEGPDRDRFLTGMQAVMGGLASNNLDGANDKQASVKESIDEQSWDREIKKVVDHMRELIARRRDDPGEDFLSGLIAAEEDGDQLSEDELVAMVLTLMSAGYETTYSRITNAVVTLLDHPDQRALLRAAPEDDVLWRSAIEELVRFTGTVAGTEMITAAQDVTWHGQTIPAGALVLPVLGAANRDPDAFEDPDRFDITRYPNNHVGFGHGVHFCLGANLARMEARVALQVLIERCPNLSLAVDRKDITIEEIPIITRYREVPVQLE